jgi:predicted transcriptional regulator
MRRSRLEIYLDVLSVIHEGEDKPTRIMYHSNLSWQQLISVLTQLEVQGLITEDAIEAEGSRRRKRDKRSKKSFNITPKGISVLKYFRDMNKMIEIEVPV